MTGTRSTGLSSAEAWPRWRRWEVLALAGITLLGVALRFHLYTQAPLFTDNMDELQFTWLGLNLIEHGDAYTWSWFPDYASYLPLGAFGTTMPMVHHWMDHPPLFGYIMGGWVWLLGDRNMLDVTPAQVRVLPVVWSSLTVPLVYLLGRQLVGVGPALVGGLLLATSPAAVLMGREAEPESLQAVLLLVALVCTLRLVRDETTSPNRQSLRWSVGGLLLCCLTAPIMKVSGLAIAGICLVILVLHGRRRLAALTGAAAIAGLLFYVLYGFLVDWQLFLHILRSQAANRLGVMSGFDFIAGATGINRPLRDGWWLLGWISIGGLLLSFQSGDRRRELFLVWPAVAYAATMMLLAGEKQIQLYGWYKVIIYPEVYLAAGFLAWTVVRRASLAGLTLLLVLGGSTATNWWLGGVEQNWVPNPIVLVGLVLAVIGPAVWAVLRRGDPGARLRAVQVATAALGFLFLGNVVESLILNVIFVRM
jgi:uncharacterized membrane protein